MSNKYDYMHIENADNNDLTLVDDLLLEFAKWVRTKAYGLDVREGIARLGERIGVILNQYQAENNRTSNEINTLKNELQSTLSGLTQDAEVKNARVDVEGVVYETLKKRLDETQLKNGELSNVIATGEIAGGSLYLEGLDNATSPFSYDIVSTNEESGIPYGVETIKVQDVGIEPVGGDS
ncbi:hypothetical protein [Fructilactobacillus fructivorans]|uniref:Uncharacterized protein n=1 Tax=Fructilactobacillus fructivorans TaxID=1614 RepID=A0AAE6TW31_9LACO|nr:hypothetical protein [Fructilactobacillus fructivorans]QFX92519.1 hypothetical protein LF543_02640 [Fructilactobacillus fructivorans]RDV65886.1 hypothetical protein DXU76_01770 [Fructilactobacillus fructivorans]